ncbi:MAG: lytic transglycosylase domain-containing protein, partial [Spirochaetaceae bacterium]|nr:lytic transglycosylase domain-containing protein [Spirochaetaceae bacterium]
METQIKNIALLPFLIFLSVVDACASETALDMTKKEAVARIERGDIAFIIDADPSRMAELSRIDPALPFYAALLIEEQDDGKERTASLLREALAEPSTRDPAAEKLAMLEQNDASAAGEGAKDDVLAAGRSAVARRDYNEALRRFNSAPDKDVFLLDNGLLGDLGRAYVYATIPEAAAGTGLFLKWEKEIRDGGRLWALPSSERAEKSYLLLYYAARTARRTLPAGKTDEYGAAEDLFARALALAPDGEQADACIWYILDISLAENGKNTGTLIKKYAPLWHDTANFSDIFERFTHLLCFNRRWDEIAELFPYVRAYGGPEILAKHAFILGNALELGFLTAEKASQALGKPFSGRENGGYAPLPEDFYLIACDSGVIAGRDTSSFYYSAAAARKLNMEPRLNVPPKSADGESDGGMLPGPQGDVKLLKKFLSGFFVFGAARFAYPYIIRNEAVLSVPELRGLSESLAGAGHWGESIRLARTYMQRTGYSPGLDDLRLCYPAAYADIVAEASEETGMDETVLYGLIRTESLFTPDIVSRAGAVGLTQLMPETARETALRLERNGGPDYFKDGGLDLADPALNIHLGALYFERLKDSMGSSLLAALSYNGGMNRIRRWLAARPTLNEALFLESVDYAETRSYG